MCAGTEIPVSSRFSVNSPNHSGRSRKRSSESRLVFFLVFEFLVNRDSFLVPDRHFALLLDLKVYLTSPAVAM